MYDEYIGLTQEVSGLIERRRHEPGETKNDILRRILKADSETRTTDAANKLDVGQGVHIAHGESLYLYLSKPQHDSQRPDAIAEVRAGRLFLDDEQISPSHGSVITPAMRKVQERLGHVNKDGKLISLSAFRQWHVIRNGRLIPLDDIKDPKLRRTRMRKVDQVDLSALKFEL